MIYCALRIRKEYALQIRNAIDVFTTDFPVIKKMVKILHCKQLSKEMQGCFATSRILWGFKFGYEIKLNPEAFSKPRIEEKFYMALDSNYESINDIIYHEFGHCLQAFMLCEAWGIDIKQYYYFNFTKYLDLGRSENAIDLYKKYFSAFLKEFGWGYTEIKKHLGVYAANDPWEMLPECFNNYYRLKAKDKLSIEEEKTYKFVKRVMDDYKGYIPQRF